MTKTQKDQDTPGLSTITAIATPPGSGGIGIIKISGPDAFSIGASLFRPIKSHRRVSNSFGPDTSNGLKSHFLYHGHIIVPSTEKVLDEVLITFMRNPHTYTREDVVEIHAHAGPYILRSLLELVVQAGARLAEPGEFTKRAFLNGRIDLTRAEGIIDMLNAESSLSLDAAASQITGGLQIEVARMGSVLLDMVAGMEAAIEFPEDVGDPLEPQGAHDLIQSEVLHPIKKMIERHQTASFIREGLNITIVGGPNVGKSSLMNLLANKDSSIVTPVPGTTRDLIEERLVLNNTHIILSDTAGLHDTSDAVEKIGIEKAQARIDASDLVLFVIQADLPVAANEHGIYDVIGGKRFILVVNKCDLMEAGVPPCIPASWKEAPVVMTSALYQKGIDELIQVVGSSLADAMPPHPDPIVPNLRHKFAFESAYSSAEAAASGFLNDIPLDLLVIDLKAAISSLNDIVGEGVSPDVLDHIFSRFCIGK